MQKKVFDPKSPGFIYSIISFILVLLAAAGVSFGQDTPTLAGEITTTLSTGGVWALGALLFSSFIVPVWNAFKSGATTLKGLWNALRSSWLTWIALANAFFSALAIYGFVLPEGTIEAGFEAVRTKDWMALFALLGQTVIPTIVRYFKQQKLNDPVLTM
jgi:hypothetical protein